MKEMCNELQIAYNYLDEEKDLVEEKYDDLRTSIEEKQNINDNWSYKDIKYKNEFNLKEEEWRKKAILHEKNIEAADKVSRKVKNQ